MQPKIIIEDYSLEDGVFTCNATDESEHAVTEITARTAYYSGGMDEVEVPDGKPGRENPPSYYFRSARRDFYSWLTQAERAKTGEGEHKAVCKLLGRLVNEHHEAAMALKALPTLRGMVQQSIDVRARVARALASFPAPSHSRSQTTAA